jgi:hypothetical protein
MQKCDDRNDAFKNCTKKKKKKKTKIGEAEIKVINRTVYQLNFLTAS